MTIGLKPSSFFCKSVRYDELWCVFPENVFLHYYLHLQLKFTNEKVVSNVKCISETIHTVRFFLSVKAFLNQITGDCSCTKSHSRKVNQLCLQTLLKNSSFVSLEFHFQFPGLCSSLNPFLFDSQSNEMQLKLVANSTDKNRKGTVGRHSHFPWLSGYRIPRSH